MNRLLVVAAWALLPACVRDSGGPPPDVAQVVLAPAVANLVPGATQQFSASGRASDGSTVAVEATYAATGGSVSPAGLYTAGNTPGLYRVIASLTGGTLADTSDITVTAGGGTYTTSFNSTEKPISEGSNWINGRTVGLDWGDAATAGGFAHGVHVATQFADPTAVLAGSWSRDQQAEGVVFGVDALGGFCSTEVEIRLRSAIAPRVNRGYEVFWSLRSGNTYLQVVRWNGALGDFDELYNTGAGGPTPVNGYKLRARMVGDVITMWVLDANGNVVWTDSVTDNDGPGGHAVFADGAPGMGFYIGSSCLGNLQDENRFGFTSFTATDLIGAGSSLEAVPASGRRP